MRTSKTIRIERITALWALNESGLGGFMHVFNTPFTGLIVGGVSILMVSLIAYYAEQKWQMVLRALVVVLMVKIAVSPHSPVGAYVAVAFQGLIGALLLSNFSWRGLVIPVFGVITFIESATQKLLILTILYGTGLWEAINVYGRWVQTKLQLFTNSSATEILITMYLVSYAVSGVIVGFFIKRIIRVLSKNKQKLFELPEDLKVPPHIRTPKRKRRKFLLVWLSTMLVVVVAFLAFGDLGLGWQKAIYVLCRSILVLLLWYLILGPIVLRGLQNLLRSKASKYEVQVHETLDILPYLTPVIKYSWQETSNLKGYARIQQFIALSISNCIHFKL